jgi:pyrimidine operon attenuation protein/uracil phosphoribosyltransferase
MIILDQATIERKIKRLAFQVLEQNYTADRIFIVGINSKGKRFAELIHKELNQLSEKELILGNISLSPADPVNNPIECSVDLKTMNDQHVIIFDDVANTGRTLFYACRPLFEIVPRKLETGVLVDRKHKNFPIQVDYVGLSLATTISNHITVNFEESQMKATLE